MALLAQLSELAKKRAVTPEVQAEAATLWKEQTDAATQLKALAAKNEVTVTDEPDRQGLKVLQSLSKLGGVKFDKSFLDAQSDAQDTLETTLELGSKSRDADIKALAQADLDILKAERDRVRKLGL
jgi:predicted outer membrane protein